MKYDVFISYSSHDQKIVEGLCAYLEQYKIRCFVAYRDIPRGKPWPPYIPEALNESRMMVVVFSGNFNRSEEVDRELTIASKKKKPILTFRLSDEEFKGTKEYYLSNINWIDAFPNPENAFGNITDSIVKLLDIDVDLQEESVIERSNINEISYELKNIIKLAELGVDGVKIHMLCALEGTKVAKMYRDGELDFMSEDEYVSTVCDFLEYLPPQTTIHRLAGNGLKSELVAPRWIGKKLDTLNRIDREFVRRGSRQGSKFAL